MTRRTRLLQIADQLLDMRGIVEAAQAIQLALARTELRRVALGAPRDGGWVEVIDGLAAGDRVVLDVAIEEGARIDPIESLKGDAP